MDKEELVNVCLRYEDIIEEKNNVNSKIGMYEKNIQNSIAYLIYL